MSGDPLTDKDAAEAFTKSHRHYPNENLGHRFGRPEGRCWGDVWEKHGSCRCGNKPKVTLADGSLWCGIHEPAAVRRRAEKSAAREAAERAKWSARWSAERERAKRAEAFPRLLEALRQIERGHNDPRALAREVLADWPEEQRSDDAA